MLVFLIVRESRAPKVRESNMTALVAAILVFFTGSPDGVTWGTAPDGIIWGTLPDGVTWGANPDERDW